MVDEHSNANRRDMFAIVNVLSGEREAADFVKEELERLLGTSQVHVLNFKNPDWRSLAVDFIKNEAKSAESIFVVAGGDGTVSLGLQLVEDASVTNVYTAVIPMGTGNDLSRSLGFGPGFTMGSCCCSLTSLQATIDKIAQGQLGELDLWNVTARSANAAPREDDETSTITFPMVNYFSIGFDAAIATRFANFRKAHPTLCSSRAMNKAWYGIYGMNAMCCEPIVSKVASVQVEGRQTQLPEGIKSLVVSNVDSFAAGVKLWKDPDPKKKYAAPRPSCRENDGNPCPFTPVSLSDGLLECQGIYGSTHMGMMQMGLRYSERIAQGSSIEIVLESAIMCQVDGEPLEELLNLCDGGPVSISISFLRKAKIVSAE